MRACALQPRFDRGVLDYSGTRSIPYHKSVITSVMCIPLPFRITLTR
jgi:hypothetical protein